MRIGITGAHGTGKTTLAKAISQKLNLPLISEQARIVANQLGIKSSDELLRDKNLAREFQVTVLLAQIGMEDAFPDGFVSDRTALDCLAYWRLYGLCEEGEVGRTYVNQCLTRAYDILIYVPPEIPAGDDGFRLAGLQREVDRLIRSIICNAQSPGRQTFDESHKARSDGLFQEGRRARRSGEAVVRCVGCEAKSNVGYPSRRCGEGAPCRRTGAAAKAGSLSQPPSPQSPFEVLQ